MTSLLIIIKLMISQNIAMSWTCYVLLHNEATLNDCNDLFCLTVYLIITRSRTVPVLAQLNLFNRTTLGPL